MKHGTLQVRVRRRWLLMPRWNHGFVQIMQIIPVILVMQIMQIIPVVHVMRVMQIILVIRIMHIIPVVQAMQIMQSMLAILIVQAMHCDTKEQRRSLPRPPMCGSVYRVDVQ